jgi:hypothetical protein
MYIYIYTHTHTDIYIYIYICCVFVGLDNKLYKMHGTYIRIVYLPLLTLYCSYIIVVIIRHFMAAYGVVVFYVVQENSGITSSGRSISTSFVSLSSSSITVSAPFNCTNH